MTGAESNHRHKDFQNKALLHTPTHNLGHQLDTGSDADHGLVKDSLAAWVLVASTDKSATRRHWAALAWCDRRGFSAR